MGFWGVGLGLGVGHGGVWLRLLWPRLCWPQGYPGLCVTTLGDGLPMRELGTLWAWGGAWGGSCSDDGAPL